MKTESIGYKIKIEASAQDPIELAKIGFHLIGNLLESMLSSSKTHCHGYSSSEGSGKGEWDIVKL